MASAFQSPSVDCRVLTAVLSFRTASWRLFSGRQRIALNKGSSSGGVALGDIWTWWSMGVNRMC
eukprot:501897-Amorphochlora_amoeboformis.AAC.1